MRPDPSPTRPHRHPPGAGPTPSLPTGPTPGPADASGGAPGLAAYGVVRGRPLEQRVSAARGPQDSPHLHVRLAGGARQYDAAVNVFSKDGSEVLYAVVPQFSPPKAPALLALPPGATPIRSGDPNGLGLDYLRQHLVARAAMTLLPVDPARPTTDLQNALGALVTSAIADGSELFVFGSLFTGPGSAPSVANPFGLTPDAGVHDVHMNQGNPPGAHGGDNGAYQDGALLVHAPGSAAGWTAVFIAFQTQSFAPPPGA